MNKKIKKVFWMSIVLLLSLVWSPAVLAKPEPGACVEQGALVWNDWTSADAGGSGLPAGEAYRDYVRCKSCHGWVKPNQDMLAAGRGFETFDFFVTRLTQPESCP